MRSVTFVLAVLAIILATPVQPVHAGKAETAKNLVDEAIAHYKEVGKAQAIEDFNDKSSRFVEDEYYVILARGDNGVFKAHPINSALIDNKKIWDLKDVNGKYIIREMVEAGKKNPGGSWVEYVWTHPETEELTTKRTWVERHDGMLFMVGFYVQDG